MNLRHTTNADFHETILTGALEVSIANMYKEDRNATDEVYVVGFVPNHLLPKKQPNALDPFLEPLISEIEKIFINVSHFLHVLQYNCILCVVLENICSYPIEGYCKF